MKEILIISNYYPPEKGAAANRIEQLAQKLHQNKYDVTVVCPLGNYPQGKLFAEYEGKFFVSEIRNSIQIKRLWIFPSNSKNIALRLFSVLSFSVFLFIYLVFKKIPKTVVVQSPPLLLSFVSIFVLSLNRKKIILNVSDLWPLAALELNLLNANSISHKVSLFFERFIYKRASLVLGQSKEINSHIKNLFPNKECHLYRNFPELDKAEFQFIECEHQAIKIFYAGLFGIAQGVLNVCKKISLPNNVELHLFGEGNETEQIKNWLNKNPEKKIFFHGTLSRFDLHRTLQTFDIAFVPLKTRIYGSVPSKIFEYASLGFPILYFAGGEGEKLVLENNLGWVVEVENFEELNSKISEFSKVEKSALTEMKTAIKNTALREFDLDYQFNELMLKNVF